MIRILATGSALALLVTAAVLAAPAPAAEPVPTATPEREPTDEPIASEEPEPTPEPDPTDAVLDPMPDTTDDPNAPDPGWTCIACVQEDPVPTIPPAAPGEMCIRGHGEPEPCPEDAP